MKRIDAILALYRTRFAAFNRFAFGELHPSVAFHNSPFIDVLADRLEACARGDIRRLPSMVCSRFDGPQFQQYLRVDPPTGTTRPR